MDTDSFEEMLSNNKSVYDVKTSPLDSSGKPAIQKANKNASLDDLISMINRLVSISMRNEKVVFEADEGKEKISSPEYAIDNPYISYKVISREPKQYEIKPRSREVFDEKTKDGVTNRVGEVYGQRFKCSIQFNIWSNTREEANKIMEMFEDMMFTYTGYFKKNGVGEILFKKQYTDEHYDIFRQKLSIRNLEYYVEVEKLIVIFNTKVNEIEVLLNKKE